MEHLWTFFLGLYAGGMLTEACVLVPFWRSLQHEDFLRWYAANSRLLDGFYTPLTAIPGVLALTRLPSPAALLILTCVAMFPLYFARVNGRFRAGTATPSDLANWSRLHALRTVLCCAALAQALASA